MALAAWGERREFALAGVGFNRRWCSGFGLLIVFTMQALLALTILALIVLGDRSHAKIIPLRDAELFIESATRLSSLP